MTPTYLSAIGERLQKSHILVDTCVISEIFYHPQAFADFYGFLTSQSCTLCVNDFVALEFLRLARDSKIRDQIEQFFTDKFFTLPTESNILRGAKEIYPLFSYCQFVRSRTQVSVVDVINISFLKRYSTRLFFLTLDHNDYPLEMLDRIAVGAIDLGKEVIAWGIYQFNALAYSKLLSRYNYSSV